MMQIKTFFWNERRLQSLFHDCFSYFIFLSNVEMFKQLNVNTFVELLYEQE